MSSKHTVTMRYRGIWGSLISIVLFMVLFVSSSVVCARHFVLISAPGSGKGTFSQYCIKNYGYVQICPGDFFRKEIREQTALGKKIQPIVEKGELVEEDITCQLVADNIVRALEQKKPFIIDGFPRSQCSFDFICSFFEKRGIAQEVWFIQFLARDTVCVERIRERVVCTHCSSVYNRKYVRPQNEGVCDECGTILTARFADTESVAQHRVRCFHENAELLLEAALPLYAVKKIETECSLQELYVRYNEALL